jgi:hypothetical protein
MASNPRLDRIETNLEKLTQVTGALAPSITAHDDQIENLLHIAELQQERGDSYSASGKPTSQRFTPANRQPPKAVRVTLRAPAEPSIPG